MIKNSYSVQMSHQVSDAEKEQAEKAIKSFSVALKLLKSASDHLDIMLTPFKDHSDISKEQLTKFRAALRRFRDRAIDNFNTFKITAFQCFTLMNLFSTDTQTLKLMKSFISSIEGIEKQVNDFADLFGDLESKTFVTDVVKAIESVKKECEELKDIIDERITPHIQKNIIGKTWVDSVSSDLKMEVEKQTPLFMDLFSERQDQLNESQKDKNK